MKHYDDFNNLSKEYRDELKTKKLKRGEIAVYRFLNPMPEVDPDRRAKGYLYRWPAGRSFRLRDAIHDPFDGETKDIGVVETVDQQGNKVTDVFRVPTYETDGFFRVHGGNIQDEKFYEFFECTNLNASNPHRDTSVEPEFERIDEVAISKKQNISDDLLTDMLTLVKSLSAAERKEIANSLGWGFNQDDDHTLRLLRDMIKKDAAGFEKLVGNKTDLNIMATINDGIVKGVITHTAVGNKFTFTKTGEVIATFDINDKKDPKEQLLEWIKSHPKGKNVLTNIQKLLSPKKD